jgi:hypothetical protein
MQDMTAYGIPSGVVLSTLGGNTQTSTIGGKQQTRFYLLVGTKEGYLLRWDWVQHGNAENYSLENLVATKIGIYPLSVYRVSYLC